MAFTCRGPRFWRLHGIECAHLTVCLKFQSLSLAPPSARPARTSDVCSNLTEFAFSLAEPRHPDFNNPTPRLYAPLLQNPKA